MLAFHLPTTVDKEPDLTTNNEAPRYIEYSGDNIISSTDLFMIRYGQPGVIGYGGSVAKFSKKSILV